MMSEKILSVVVPTFNMERLLARCLSSLVLPSNLMDQLEVLVINDGSTDTSSAIAHEFEKRYPETFRVIDKTNGNYGSCVNRGLSEAIGKYIKILDADDSFNTLNTKEFLNYLQLCSSELVISDVRSVHHLSENTLTHNLPQGESFKLDAISYDAASRICMHSITYKTDILRQMGYKQTEGISYTDLEWSLYPMSRVLFASYFPKVVYVYDTSREGQTIAPIQHAKNMWMESNVISSMLSSYEYLLGNAIETSKQYIYGRLRSYVNRFYDYYLLDLTRYLTSSDLLKFDEFLLKTNPSIYVSLDGETLNRKFLPSFRYIKLWRQDYSRRNIQFMIYDLYKFCIDIIYPIFR